MPRKDATSSHPFVFLWSVLARTNEAMSEQKYYGAFVNYGDSANLLVCRVTQQSGGTYAFDFKHCWAIKREEKQFVVEHHTKLSFEEELRTIKSASVAARCKAEELGKTIEQLLKKVYTAKEIAVTQLFVSNLEGLF